MKKKTVIAINIFVGFVSFASWLYMGFLGGEGQLLTSRSVESLKFFTILSNLFNGAVSFWYARLLIKERKLTSKMKICKLMSTSAVGLTFLTVMVFLGPLYGYPMMFKGANFWLHLVLPVLSMVSYVTLESNLQLPLRKTGYAMIAPLIYEIGYVGNMVINGIGEWPDSNDFYGFVNWGYGVAAVIAVVVLLITWLIAVVLSWLSQGRGFWHEERPLADKR